MEGDEEEDDVDNFENEFNYILGGRDDRKQRAEAMMQWHMHGQREEIDYVTSSRHDSHTQVPLLTNDQPV